MQGCRWSSCYSILKIIEENLFRENTLKIRHFYWELKGTKIWIVIVCKSKTSSLVKRRDVPEKRNNCISCGNMIHHKDLNENLRVCMVYNTLDVRKIE